MLHRNALATPFDGWVDGWMDTGLRESVAHYVGDGRIISVVRLFSIGLICLIRAHLIAAVLGTISVD